MSIPATASITAAVRPAVRRFAHVFQPPQAPDAVRENDIRECLTRALRDAHHQVDPDARVECVVSFHPASVVLCGDAACAGDVDTERVARLALAVAAVGPEPEWII